MQAEWYSAIELVWLYVWMRGHNLIINVKACPEVCQGTIQGPSQMRVEGMPMPLVCPRKHFMWQDNFDGHVFQLWQRASFRIPDGNLYRVWLGQVHVLQIDVMHVPLAMVRMYTA